MLCKMLKKPTETLFWLLAAVFFGLILYFDLVQNAAVPKPTSQEGFFYYLAIAAVITVMLLHSSDIVYAWNGLKKQFGSKQKAKRK